jgi:hypothetical protein
MKTQNTIVAEPHHIYAVPILSKKSSGSGFLSDTVTAKQAKHIENTLY